MIAPARANAVIFGIAFADRAVGAPSLTSCANALVDARLELLDLAAHRRAQVLVLGLHHAPAEVGRDGLRIALDDVREALARTAGGIADLLEALHDLVQAGAEALEQELLLVLDVVIDRRLGHVELARDVIERGVVISARPECARRGQNHCFALAFAVARASVGCEPEITAARGPGGGLAGRLFRHCLACPRACHIRLRCLKGAAAMLQSIAGQQNPSDWTGARLCYYTGEYTSIYWSV